MGPDDQPGSGISQGENSGLSPGFSLNMEQRNRLKDFAARRKTAEVDRLRNIDTPQVPELRRQELVDKDGKVVERFGSIEQEQAQMIAAISEATGSKIVLVGSAAADPDRLLEARYRYGDLAQNTTGTSARPISDYDFLIQSADKVRYDTTCAMLQKHVMDAKNKAGQQEPLSADYMPNPEGTIDHNRPYISFSNGKVESYSPGESTYYSPEGGGVKIRQQAS